MNRCFRDPGKILLYISQTYFGTMLPAQIISQSTLGPPFRGLYPFFTCSLELITIRVKKISSKNSRVFCVSHRIGTTIASIYKKRRECEKISIFSFFFSQLLYFYKNFTLFHIDLQILFGSITIQCVW